MYDLRSEPEIARLASSLSSNSPSPSNSPPTSSHGWAQPSLSSSSSRPSPGTSTSTPFLTPPGTISVPGITRHFTPVYDSEDYGPVALARKLKWYTAPNDSSSPSPSSSSSSSSSSSLGTYSAGFVSAYRDIALHGTSAYATILRRILASPVPESVSSAETSAAILFHCTAGKDRTGVLAALLLLLARVDVPTVCWEYAITEPGLGSWRELFIARIARTGGLGGGGGGASNHRDKVRGNGAEEDEENGKEEMPGLSRAEAARICGSRAANMAAWIEQVLEGEEGGVERYLRERCGLSEAEIEGLRARLVVEVPDGSSVVECVGIEGWSLERGMLADEDDEEEDRERKGATHVNGEVVS